MNPIRFGIVGTGWRAEFYLRVARALPDRFTVCGVATRSHERVDWLRTTWNVKGFRSLDEMLETDPGFVVTSVPWGVNPGLLRELVARKMPALSETPPAPDLDGLVALCRDVREAGGRVQVAEEYHRRPVQAAQLALARSGKFGRITHAQVSVGHGYHGVSLLRRLLEIDDEPATIVTREFRAPIVAGPDRRAGPDREIVRESVHQVTTFEFGDRGGVLDFTGDQYFGHVRRERLLFRGERGEMLNGDAVYLKDPNTPIALTLVRHHQDLLTGVALRGLQAGEAWVYENPYVPAPLTDDEIAVADCLALMDEYVRTGKEFYPLAEGAQDHHLYLLLQQAAKQDAPVRSRAGLFR